MNSTLTLQEQLEASCPRSHKLTDRRCLTLLYLAHARQAHLLLNYIADDGSRGIIANVPDRRPEFDEFDAAVVSGELQRIVRSIEGGDRIRVPSDVAHAGIELWVKENYPEMANHFSINYRWHDEVGAI